MLKSKLVVVLKTSHPRRISQGSHHHHENCYITGTVDIERFLKVVRSINSFLVVGG